MDRNGPFGAPTLRPRVAELESAQRRTAIMVARHDANLEVIGDILRDIDGEEPKTRRCSSSVNLNYQVWLRYLRLLANRSP